MARTIVVAWEGVSSTFDFEKLERSRLYGQRKRIVLGPDSLPCVRAELVQEGDVLLTPGMTAQGYFDEEGRWYPNSALEGLDPEGRPLPKVPSTLGEPQALEGPIEPAAALDVAVETVYSLSPTEVSPALLEQLKAGAIFRFPFNYRADWQASEALLLANEEGVFALVGQRVTPEWCSLETPPPAALAEDEEEELDFQMF